MKTELEFTPRSALAEHEWEAQNHRWRRPTIDAALLKQLSERSTLKGAVRVGAFLLLLAASAAATVWAASYRAWLAIVPLYAYYFLYGFWVAIGHELQHKMVFARSAEGFSEVFFFFVQLLMWNSPRYARISHRLHHRYTMIRGLDPETNWPDVFTSHWLKHHLRKLILRILVVGALIELGLNIKTQVDRALGKQDRMMRDHCKASDIRAIRIESAVILLIHAGIIMVSILYRRWEPVVFVTLAWQIGSAIESLWHDTQHIGRLYDTNDQRLATRSVRVGRFVKWIYWGLDDHVDHHIFPSVPAINLPRLHEVLKDSAGLAQPRTMLGCWREMFAIAREKDRRPANEYVPVSMPAGGAN